MQSIDNSIIEKAAGGDISAFEEIYKTFSSMVYTLAYGVTQNRMDAEEATQDVFVRIYRSLKDFRFGSSFSTWIYRIAMNTAINVYHKNTKRRNSSIPYDEAGDLIPAVPHASKDEIEKQEATAQVDTLLKALSPEHRTCIVLREIEGLEYSQMAEVLAIPINTVRSRLKRAREALVAYCRKEGIHHGL